MGTGAVTWWVAFLLALALLAPATAGARGGAVAVVVGEKAGDTVLRSKVEPLLGGGPVEWLLPEEAADRLDVYSLLELPWQRHCGEVVQAEHLGDRLAQAQERFQLLDLSGALASLAALEFDLPCLATVPRRMDLFVMGLLMAEAHALAASAATGEERASHEQEREYGLRLALAFGADLPAPSWLSPDLDRELVERRAVVDPGEEVPVHITGPVRGVWLDGQLVSTGTRRLSAGRHLVQVVVGDQHVVSAAMVDVKKGRPALIRVATGDRAVVGREIALAFRAAVSPEGGSDLLLDAISLLGAGGRDVLVVELSSSGARAWRRTGNTMEEITLSPGRAPVAVAGEAARPEDSLQWTIAVGGGALYTTLAGPQFGDLGGVAGGPALSARLTLRPPIALALSVEPMARVLPLPIEEEDYFKVRVMVPVRGGVRFGAPRRGVWGEAGLDGGLLYLGMYERQEARAFGALTAGISVPLAPGLALQLEGLGMVGRDLAGFGGQVRFGLY